MYIIVNRHGEALGLPAYTSRGAAAAAARSLALACRESYAVVFQGAR